MVIKIVFVLIQLFSRAHADEKLGSIKDMKFVPDDLIENNKVEWSGQNLNLNNIYYKMAECRPLVLQLENGSKIYRPSQDKVVRYVERLYTSNIQDVIELKINGKAISGHNLAFSLISNCTEWIPIRFTAKEDQNYLGISVKKDSVISPFLNKNEHLIWGEIAEDGYLKAGRSIDPSQDKSQVKKLEDFEYAQAVFSSPPSCIEVVESEKSNKGFYIFAGKKIPFEQARPNFWRAKSKYIGHRLCSDQPKAVVDCQGASLRIDENHDDIFGTSGPDLSYAVNPEEKANVIVEYQQELKKAHELGKKCDEAIAKYEKETGKKVRISPLYPKELLEKEKKK